MYTASVNLHVVYNLICVYYHINGDKGTFLYTCELYGHYTNSMQYVYQICTFDGNSTTRTQWLASDPIPLAKQTHKPKATPQK